MFSSIDFAVKKAKSSVVSATQAGLGLKGLQ
jgi:hypothetical protein